MNKAIIPFFLCILVSVAASAQSRKTTDLMNEYLEAAFWKTGDNLQPLTKWAEIDTLKYVISGSFQFMSAKNWEKFTQEMGLLSGKVIVESPDDTYQILIHFGSLEEYSVKYKIGIPMNLTEKFSNWSNRTFGQNQELHTTSFCIDPNKVINYNEGE